MNTPTEQEKKEKLEKEILRYREQMKVEKEEYKQLLKQRKEDCEVYLEDKKNWGKFVDYPEYKLFILPFPKKK